MPQNCTFCLEIFNGLSEMNTASSVLCINILCAPIKDENKHEQSTVTA